MRTFENILLVTMPLIFSLMLALTFLFGSQAVPVTDAAIAVAVGKKDLRSHARLLHACRSLACKEFIADRILQINPHHLEAIGAKAVILSQRGLWREAESRFDQYFAEGGGAPEVQKWYQKLLGQQASVKAEL
jgi:hypothetical protein